MFTGIIQHSGVIESLEKLESGARLLLRTTYNGVCLTVMPYESGFVESDVSNETLARTTIGRLGAGARVNVERAMRLSDRLGGHLVQGHVDAVGTLVSIMTEGEFAVYRWSYPREFADLVVSKGSIAVDGVSLTVVDPDAGSLGAALIPETLSRTNLGDARVGTLSNLEFDVIAKYVRRLGAPYLSGTPST
jgi:riboflavin synthase